MTTAHCVTTILIGFGNGRSLFQEGQAIKVNQQQGSRAWVGVNGGKVFLADLTMRRSR